MTDPLIEQIKADAEKGTKGNWETPYELFDNGWSLDTDGENSYVGIGIDNAAKDYPLAIVAVEVAYGLDDVLDANARRIARVPEYEARILADAEEKAASQVLRKALVEAYEEILWNAYNTGHERDGEWTHCFMSDGEWLVSECGLDPTKGRYDPDRIKADIPFVAARQVKDLLASIGDSDE